MSHSQPQRKEMNMLKKIDINSLSLSPFNVFDKGWFLLSAGNFKENDWNCMTVSWGFIGTMWNKPVAQVVVRPQRYTCEFMDKYNSFTLCAFPEKHRPALQLFGSKSGRNIDKKAGSGLCPIAATEVDAPIFKEADLVLECRKLFRLPMPEESFLDESLKKLYPADDYHIIYIGEVLTALTQ